MHVVKRIPTVKQQADTAWRSQDSWTRETLRELARLGYDLVSVTPGEDRDIRIYLVNVGAKALNVVVRVNADGVITRVAISQQSLTARQAALWLHKRAAREKRYL